MPRPSKPELRDAFLCHAWDDRLGAARDIHDLLEARGARVWFSEKDVGLGVHLMRAIDEGLAASRIGIARVTPSMLLPTRSFQRSSRASGWCRSCIKRHLQLCEVSPLLASRSGLSTAKESMREVAAKIAELVFV